MNGIGDDEIILRHIPGGSMWQAPGPVMTSANFRIRKKLGETGISVTRLSITDPDQLMQLAGGRPDLGSKIAQARVGDVRALGLDVVPVPLPRDPGHAEIRSAAGNLNQYPVQRRLANLFQFVGPVP